MPPVDPFYRHFFGPEGQHRSPFAVGAGGPQDPFSDAFLHPLFPAIRAPSTSFVFGSQGSGKTSLKDQVERQLRRDGYL
ncbi:MAG: hypothetical protein ACRELB_10790, partial [Polyangiaceae bacterium]